MRLFARFVVCGFQSPPVQMSCTDRGHLFHRAAATCVMHIVEVFWKEPVSSREASADTASPREVRLELKAGCINTRCAAVGANGAPSVLQGLEEQNAPDRIFVWRWHDCQAEPNQM